MADGAPGETKLTTHSRDSDALARQIAAWLESRWGRPLHVSDVHAPSGSGMSSVTILFTVDSAGELPRRLVARLAPDDDSYPVFPSYDLALQSAVMEAVADHTDVPVPEVASASARSSAWNRRRSPVPTSFSSGTKSGSR